MPQRPDRGQLPFFVYGTLREGMGLAGIIDRYAQERVTGAWLPCFRLFECGPPYVGFGSYGDRVLGDIVAVEPGAYEQALRVLDGIEGYRPPHSVNYIRAALPVRLHDRQLTAWVYMGGPRFPYDDDLVVEGGDYVTHRWKEAARYARERASSG